MEFHRFELANGATALFIPSRHSPVTVAVQVWFRGGSRVEEKTHAAHIFEHLFFRGGHFRDWRAIERELRLLGGASNAVTSDEYMGAFILTSSMYFRRAVSLLSDMVLYSECLPADFEMEKAAVVQELKTTRDDPEDFANRKFREVMFGEHPLGSVDCERMDELNSLAREDVLRYRERFCGSANALFVVVGGGSPGYVCDTLEESFRTLPAAEKAVFQPFHKDSLSSPPVKLVERPGVEQAHLYVGTHSLSAKSPDLRAVVLLYDLLSHRLWDKIRGERGLAYSALAESRAFSDTGYALAYAGVDADQSAVADALEAMFLEMARIKGGEITAAEIEEAKSVMHARLDLGLETSIRVGIFFAMQEFTAGQIKLPAEIHREIEDVTMDDLVRLAGEFWSAGNMRSLLLTSSFKDYEKLFLEQRHRFLGE